MSAGPTPTRKHLARRRGSLRPAEAVRRLAGSAATLAAGVVVGGPLLAAGTGTTAGTEPTMTAPSSESTDPQAVAEQRGRELRQARARERRATRRARLRWRQVRNLRASLGARLDGARAGLMCVHRYEGTWGDPNPPYWGGLQMDRGFQSTYAPAMVKRYGTANRWPAEAQLAAGVLAFYDGRGFGPWPNTSRTCGLR